MMVGLVSWSHGLMRLAIGCGFLDAVHTFLMLVVTGPATCGPVKF
jgi:hypothetical protein